MPDAVADVFAGLPADALLANGRMIRLVPATHDDFDDVHSFYDALSDTATYYRFFGMRPALIAEELRRSVSPDPPHHAALLARLDGRLVGIGEFVLSSDPHQAEMAIAVADDHHHEGVATLLLERLVDVARRCGIEQFIARTLPGNEEMKVVLRTLGLREQIEVSDGTIAFTLDFNSYEEMQRQTASRLQNAMRAASEMHNKHTGPGESR